MGLPDLQVPFVAAFADPRLYSLPSIDADGQRRHLELGVEGEATRVERALDEIRREIESRGIAWTWRD